MASDTPVHTVLDSSFPVLLPKQDALFLSDDEFVACITRDLASRTQEQFKSTPEKPSNVGQGDNTALSDANPSTLSPSKRRASEEVDNDHVPKAPLIVGLEKHRAHQRTLAYPAAANKTLTANLDVTFLSSLNPLVDLFYELEGETGGLRLHTLLEAAWKEDAALTLKIVFNTRSIHLGKGNKIAAYKAFGWLAVEHPLTLLRNLPWLVRPVIAKKMPKPEDAKVTSNDAEEDLGTAGAEEAAPANVHHGHYGRSHGYWKDLLNLVVFAASDQLTVNGDPGSILNKQPDGSKEGKRRRNWDAATAKEARRVWKKEQNGRVQRKLQSEPFYRALHLTVARLFAEQLKQDKRLLDSGKPSDLKKLSLAAKWSPTFGEFHDKHTFILSSIAEALFPDHAAESSAIEDRELYLRLVRERFRKEYASPLRKALHIVERDIAANSFSNIEYNRLPSLAMNRYTGLFLRKDMTRFKSFAKDVAQGNAKISGATLLPSTLIAKARAIAHRTKGMAKTNHSQASKLALELECDIIDGQWKTLVQRVRDAGTLSSCIAICDVSLSMMRPKFSDQSCPMDSAIGLSLLVTSVASAPFGGGFISFHQIPSYIPVPSSDGGLVQTVGYMEGTPWGGNTNFVAVFEDIILGMAVDKQLRRDEMVKQIFVFSDMQFDQAQCSTERWASSFERIKNKYAQAGYEMPRLIFWNLAAGATSKPITMEDGNTALVGGYSHGMLRAFLERGAFEEEEVEGEMKVEGEEMKKIKKGVDPLSVVKKAVENRAYGMLSVVD
ncbi:hypothetical protein ACEQ8H_007619 [Pleosporales sp. CAS-2024a]